MPSLIILNTLLVCLLIFFKVLVIISQTYSLEYKIKETRGKQEASTTLTEKGKYCKILRWNAGVLKKNHNENTPIKLKWY